MFSDCHCGFDFGGERGEDPFETLDEAISKNLDADLVIIAGDLFDTRVPKQEVFARTARILSKTRNVPCATKLIETIGKDRSEISPLALMGIPVVVIHGTHERRSIHMVNPIQALEHAGLVIHLHRSSVVFEIDGKKVAVHGFSGVPDRYAFDILKEWSPKPVEDAINIFVFHQSVKEYVYSPLDPPSLSLDDLPDGFDLYVLGHLHWHEIKDLKGGKLVLTGSTVPTSSHVSESDTKGYVVFDGRNVQFVPFASQRKVYRVDLKYTDDVLEVINRRLEEISSQPHDKKPVVWVKIRGTVPQGSSIPDFSVFQKKFSDRLIVRINHSLMTEDAQESVEALRLFREEKLSPEEHGLALLRKNLETAGCKINIDELFDFLVEGNVDEAFTLLAGGRK